MDTSPKYILQCERAIKIQEGWEPAGGDQFYWHKVHIPRAASLLARVGIEKINYEAINGGVFVCAKPFQKTLEDIWLPRQDQLQELVFPEPRSHSIHFETLTAFEDWHRQLSYSELVHIYSMEQLWLRYVMHEKYGNVWDSERKDWVGSD